MYFPQVIIFSQLFLAISFSCTLYYSCYSLRPPLPIKGTFGEGDVFREGYSHRFESKLPLKSLEEDLSGVLDIETARYYIAALQLHNMESMELLDRRDAEIHVNNTELDELKIKLKEV